MSGFVRSADVVRVGVVESAVEVGNFFRNEGRKDRPECVVEIGFVQNGENQALVEPADGFRRRQFVATFR